MELSYYKTGVEKSNFHLSWRDPSEWTIMTKRILNYISFGLRIQDKREFDEPGVAWSDKIYKF